jgi:hypothetical protein
MNSNKMQNHIINNDNLYKKRDDKYSKNYNDQKSMNRSIYKNKRRSRSRSSSKDYKNKTYHHYSN